MLGSVLHASIGVPVAAQWPRDWRDPGNGRMMDGHGIVRDFVDNAIGEEQVYAPQIGATGVDAEAALRFVRQFSVKLKAGLSVVKCLAALANETRNRRLQRAVWQMQEAVAKGTSLAQAMLAQGAWFDVCVVGLIERGEQTQKLRAAFATVADYLEHRNQMRSYLRSAVAQPLNALSMVLLATFIATVVLSFLVKETLPGVGHGELAVASFADRAALAVSEAVRTAWPFVGVFGLLCFVALRLVPRLPATRAWLDKMTLRLPLIGPAVHSVGVAVFYRTIGVRMQAGANLAQAMQIAAVTASSHAIRERIAAIIAKINKNRPYIEALVDHGFMRLGDVTTVQAAERRGDLGTVMVTIAGDREREAAAETKRLKALTHTVVVAFLGVTILGVVFTLYVPVFVTR